MRDPRRAYRVVDDFESELCAYTGAPYAVTVDSCTNALMLALVYETTGARIRHRIGYLANHTRGYRSENAPPIDFDAIERDMPPFVSRVVLPRRTYVGVLQAARNAGYHVEWCDCQWMPRGWYRLDPTHVVDSARRIWPGMYDELRGHHVCLSFHAAKQLPLGRGGAILTDNREAAKWLRAARMDGRPPGAPVSETVFPGFHCPLPPPVAAQGLWTLSRWVDSGYVPAPLVDEEYPDLSVLP